MQEESHNITCPTCCILFRLPDGGAQVLPNAFFVNSLIELQNDSNLGKTTQKTCPKHDDPLKVYCETCSEVICACCTISRAHNKHQYELISECYFKHYQQIQADLYHLKQKMADIYSAISPLVDREKEVVQQGEDVKREIQMHAQHLIDQIKESEHQLLEQVETIIQQKRQLLTQQKEQAERVHDQLKACEKLVESSLQSLNQQQILAEKQKMVNQMKRLYSYLEPITLQPLEKPDVKFTKHDGTGSSIGQIQSDTYGNAAVMSLPCLENTKSTSTLVLNSHKCLPLSLPIFFISCKLSPPHNGQLIQCDIQQAKKGEYTISFTPQTRGDHQLIVQVGGINIPGSPFSLLVKPLPEMRGKPLRTITGLNRPHGVALSRNGDIVVAENAAHCVTLIDKEGKKLRSFGTLGTTDGKFMNPKGVAVSNDGHILVTDWHRLQKLTFDGVCVRSVGSSKTGNGQMQLNHPRGIAVHPTTGQIFVADGGNNRIQVFNNDLTYLKTISPGILRSLKYPYDVSFDNEGCLYIVERDNGSITKLTAAGQYVKKFSSQGVAPGHLKNPAYLTINTNMVYVSDADNHRISIFDTNGNFLHCFGEKGIDEGNFNSVCGITIDMLGNLYICDTSNNSIGIY